MPTRRARVRKRIRGGFQPRTVLAVALTWCLMWDRLSWGNLLNGVLVGLIVTMLLPLPSVQFNGRPRPWGMLVLVLRFMWDLLRAALVVTWYALRPQGSPGGSIVEVQLRTRSELYLTFVSMLVALVPGSIVVEARRAAGVIYVHEMGATTPENVEKARASVLAVERRLIRAIGSNEEIALVNAPAGAT